MDKNSVIGLFLIGLVILGYMWYVAPSEEQINRQRAIQDSIRNAQEQIDIDEKLSLPPQKTNATLSPAAAEPTDSLSLALKDSELAERYGIFASSSSDESQEVIIENDVFIATVQSKGGQLKSLALARPHSYYSINAQTWMFSSS